MIVLWLILAAVVVLAAVVLVRTALFTPGTAPAVPEGEETIDRDKAVENLRTLIRCRTVSNTNHALEDDAEFEKLINTLPTLYPNVFKTCKFERLEDRGLLFTWSGKEHTEPTVLMAHYDVVDVDEAGWKKPPFEGVLEDGVLWGRGALDTKVTFNGVLTAADKLIGEGYTPAQDIYFAFSGGEEVNGLGAVHIVDWFEANHITPALVVDEGGAVVEDVFPGVKQPCGLIGIAEKGMLNVEYKVKSGGGHASAPKPHSPLVALSEACTKIESHPFKAHVTKPVAEMFDTLGRYSNVTYRMIFANLWLFGGVLDSICRKSGGELNALMRTTVAFTQAEGSAGRNVIPPEAAFISNLRLNPEDDGQCSCLPERDHQRPRRRDHEAGRHEPEPYQRDELPCLGQGRQRCGRHLEGLSCLALFDGAVLRQPPLWPYQRPCVPLLRHGSDRRGARYPARQQRAYPRRDRRSCRGVLRPFDAAVLRK